MVIKMYNFPSPYSSFYKHSIQKPKILKSNASGHHKNFDKSTKCSSDTDTNTSACINILGINLYVDDLIILFIIFILYKEKINDNELIICLLLLLLN